MNESITKVTKQFTGCASLAALGMKLKQLDLFGPIRKMVQIAQKTVKHTPTDYFSSGLWSALRTHSTEEECRRKALFPPALKRLIEHLHTSPKNYR